MIRRLATALAALLIAVPATAANKWISPTGTALWANANSPSTPASISAANSGAVAGDVVYMLPGTYGAGIAPANSGTSGARIVFMGAAGDSSSVIVPSVSITGGKDYITVKWLKVSGALNVSSDEPTKNYAVGDSIYFAAIDGGVELTGPYGLVVANVRAGRGNTAGARFRLGKSVPGSGAGVSPENVTINDSRFYHGTDNSNCGPAINWDRVRSATVNRSRFIGYTSPSTSNGACVHAQIMYNMWNSTFTDCYFEHNNRSTFDNGYLWNFRDSSRFNRAVRCTITTNPASVGSVEFAASTSGAFNGTVYANSWESCVIYVTGYFRGQGDARRQSFTGCQITHGADGDVVAMDGDSLTFVHNTLVGERVSDDVNEWIMDQQSSDPFLNATITSNIIVSKRHSVSSQAAWVMHATTSTTNYNLFYSYARPADSTQAIRVGGANYTVGPSPKTMCSTFGRECNSRWGDPAFSDTTTRNYTPAAGGNAVGAWWPDGYVGALDAAGEVPDTCAAIERPGKITDLSASYLFFSGQPSVNVAIGAVPGEHQFAGPGDNARIYVRRSSSPITEANWLSATPVFNFAPGDYDGPGAPMSQVEVGLPSGTWYYAAKAQNDSLALPVFGCLSNVDTVAIPASDLTRPAPITNLVVTSPWAGFVKLAWTAVGDDSLTGTATRYDVRYRLGEPLTAANWDDTTHTTTFVAQGRTYHFRYPVAEPGAPRSAGLSDTMRAVFQQARTVYFAIKAIDDQGFSGAISNSESTLVIVGTTRKVRRHVYGGAAPTQPSSGPRISKAWPTIYYDSLTINTTELDRLARFDVVCFNPELVAWDSSEAVVRYLRKKNPGIVLLIEPGPDIAYAQTDPDTARNDTKQRGQRRYYWRKWNVLRDITPWPSHFAYPYTGSYGIPSGYAAGSDTLTPSAWAFARGPGRKNAMLGTITDSATVKRANAGITLRNANIAYRSSAGRYLVAERTAELDAELFYDRMYETESGAVRRMWDGVFNDLHSYSMADPSSAANGDSVDWVRGGVAPWGYANRAEYDAGWTAGAIRYDLRLRELTPEWTWYPSNAGTGFSYTAGSGRLHEGFPAQDGGSWGTNASWVPGGGFHDEVLHTNRPRLNTLLLSPSFELAGDSAMVSTFNPDTNWSRKDYRFGYGSALQWGASFTYSNAKASMAHGQGHSRGSYYNWVYDEQYANRVSGQALGEAYPDSANWLGDEAGPAYAHYPSASGALFADDFKSGSVADSAQWLSLQKNANGRVGIRPTTYDGKASVNGNTFLMEIVPTSVWPSAYDWQVGGIADNARFRVDNGGVYTVSGWARADSVRWLNVWFRDSLGATAKAGNENAKRVMVGTTWAPFAMTITATVASARRVALSLAAGDTLGRVLVTGLQVHPGDSLLSIREFEHGVVLVNPSTSISKSHAFGRYTRRLTARAGIWRDVNNGELSRTVTVPAADGLFLAWSRDSLRPRAVTDLNPDVVTCDGAVLSWTSVGDDSLAGTAASYEIRARSGGAVTDANWNSATPVASGSCLPAGVKQSVTVVTGLGALASYYVGIRITDKAAFTSITSNSPTFTTSSPCVSPTTPVQIRPSGLGAQRTRVRRR